MLLLTSYALCEVAQHLLVLISYNKLDQVC